MAATLSLLILPIVPENPLRSSFPKLPNPSISAKSTTPQYHDFHFPNPLNLLDQNFDILKSASFSLSAITLPCLIHPEDAIAVEGNLGYLGGKHLR
ncbi:hypothetical protein QN277_028293 [Acacia crassicarpa]|uniref:Uncharacterized protein n=1 Tax=Acacia crassicarpa TaxID=499986 RepID=A0AAE1J2T9_9FABA|nr:hypothetical protein QN277_028293 [Acacia crassicarpa]